MGSRQMRGPDAVMLPAQLEQKIPAVKPAVMAVIEHDAHRVIAHRFQPRNFHIFLARDEELWSAAMTAHFGAGRFHPKIFGAKVETLAAVKADGQDIAPGTDAQFGRPATWRHVRVLHRSGAAPHPPAS